MPAGCRSQVGSTGFGCEDIGVRREEVGFQVVEFGVSDVSQEQAHDGTKGRALASGPVSLQCASLSKFRDKFGWANRGQSLWQLGFGSSESKAGRGQLLYSTKLEEGGPGHTQLTQCPRCHLRGFNVLDTRN